MLHSVAFPLFLYGMQHWKERVYRGADRKFHDILKRVSSLRYLTQRWTHPDIFLQNQSTFFYSQKKVKETCPFALLVKKTFILQFIIVITCIISTLIFHYRTALVSVIILDDNDNAPIFDEAIYNFTIYEVLHFVYVDDDGRVELYWGHHGHAQSYSLRAHSKIT